MPDELWAVVEPLLHEEPAKPKGGGRVYQTAMNRPGFTGGYNLRKMSPMSKKTYTPIYSSEFRERAIQLFKDHRAEYATDNEAYLPITPGGANLFFQLVNARYEKGAMILTSNRGFAELGDVFGDPVVATALLDRLLHHAIVVQIEGASYRLRAHADLMPEHLRSNAPISPPPAPRRRGRPPKKEKADHAIG